MNNAIIMIDKQDIEHALILLACVVVAFIFGCLCGRCRADKALAEKEAEIDKLRQNQVINRLPPAGKLGVTRAKP